MTFVRPFPSCRQQRKQQPHTCIITTSVAITFVVVLSNDNDDDNEIYEFGNFYNLALDLEELLLDEIENIIIAPFHPHWSFASNDNQEEKGVDNGSEEEEIGNVLDYEKKVLIQQYPLFGPVQF